MTDTRPPASSGRSFLRRPQREHTAIDGVLETYHRMYPKSKTALIEQAYAVANVAHEGQLRKSGEPYITHPIAVAQIIADLGLPESVIAAALLHDVVEQGLMSQLIRINDGNIQGISRPVGHGCFPGSDPPHDSNHGNPPDR